MSSIRLTNRRPPERERELGSASRNADGHYICFRECADGNPCKRIINVPRMPCYDHFGQPPMRQAFNGR
mgnify:CR=1 FL=1